MNGQLVAFGSSEQLKHRHGEYFTLKIVMPVATSLEKIEQVKESVAAMFTGFHFESLHAVSVFTFDWCSVLRMNPFHRRFNQISGYAQI